MEAYISSSLGAYLLLQGLEECAKGMTKLGIRMNGAVQQSSTKGKSLRLLQTIEGRLTVVTIVGHNQRTLVASLDDQEAPDEVTAKKRLAALLIPLISEYVGSQNADRRTGDRVRIVFGEAADKRRRGKRCVLFAEDAAGIASPKLRPGKPLPSSAADAAAGTAGRQC